MKRYFLLVIVVFSAFLWGCGNNSNAPEKVQKQVSIIPSPLYVKNDKLMEKDFHVLLRGVNVAESFKYYRKNNYDHYFGKVTEGDFKWLREAWGFNFVRLLFEWYAFEPEENQWDNTYLENYARRVSWASENGIYILVDMHQDLYGVGFRANGAPVWTCDSKYYYDARKHWLPRWWYNYFQPGIIACFDHLWNSKDLWENFGETWQKIAKRFKNSQYIIGFEFLNEPFPGSYGPFTFEREILSKFYTFLAEKIREVAPNKLLFFEPSIMRGAGFQSNLTYLPFEQKVYAPHYYDPTIH